MSYEKMMAQDLGPVPAVTVGFPVQLDDAALLQMYERRQTMTAAIEVPPGLALAAARAFPDANAGSFDTYGALPLTVARGHVVRLHRGVEHVFAEGEEVLLRRLDVLRVPGAATLTHTVLGEFPVAAGSEITAWTVHQWLLPTQRVQVEALVVAMLARDSEACAVLEAMLPAAYFEIRLRYVNVPTAWKSEDAYLMMHRFNGGSAHPVSPV